MSEQKRIARFTGRIEFIACKDDILELHQRGFDNKRIHATLLAKRRITMSYGTFYSYMRQLIEDGHAQEHAIRAHDRGRRPTQGTSGGRSNGGGFSINPRPTKEELF